MRRFLGLSAALAAATALLGLSAGQALATHVSCGDVITQDTRLDSDLIDCPGDGIVMAADNITLDLGGYTIDGVTTSPFHGATGIAGTTTDSCPHGCSRGVTIENGSIQQFFIGIELNPAGASVIRRLVISDSYGIEVGGGDGMRIVRNRVRGGSMFVGSSFDTVIARNQVSNGGIGIGGGSRGRIVGNRVVDSPYYGIRVSDASDHEIVGNSVSGNKVGIGASSSAYRTLIQGNFAYANVEDGIQVDCCESMVVRNVANANGDDGIEVTFGSDEFGPNVVARNAANDNADLGIEASLGVTDGGHNRANGNDNPLQCLNVACRTRGNSANR
jgi:parallel beta-helix repeat protein